MRAIAAIAPRARRNARRRNDPSSPRVQLNKCATKRKKTSAAVEVISMEKQHRNDEPRRAPPGEPGDDLKSDPIALARAGRPYFVLKRADGAPAVPWVAIGIVLVVALCVVAYLIS